MGVLRKCYSSRCNHSLILKSYKKTKPNRRRTAKQITNKSTLPAQSLWWYFWDSPEILNILSFDYKRKSSILLVYNLNAKDQNSSVLHYCCCCCCAQSCLTFCNPMTIAHQAPLSMDFSRQKYCSWLPFPSPGESSPPKAWTQVSSISYIGR